MKPQGQSNEENLQITVPAATKRSLRLKAAESGETMRVIVLKALADAGIHVPSKELLDRRKSK
ncbi:hypothetical protein XH83_22585 [Bradyrhizobium sp. CCBAU 53351]|uniref:hypothetical protein n=1 Tax=Bradyrhizobium sp. CCBAU 53351 TaxID=1325114 RepID=UPI00188965AC|nr:hypothetical protein [Bradyrhizobium sp. CCBAU 53351]QOZ77974.1 hypothetical protein XH83_22585 [Bradyrhizobium sp. CCBAU 53351]